MNTNTQKTAGDAMLAAAIAAHQAGRRVEAEAMYRQVLSVRPKDPQVHYLAGAVSLELNALERARLDLERAVALQTQYLPARALLGVVYSLLGETEKALTYLDEAARGQPKNAEAQFNLALALLKQSRFADALAAYERALTLKPDHAGAVGGLVKCLTALNQPDAVIDRLQGLARRAPESSVIQVLLARELVSRQRDEDAADVLQKCLARDPNDKDALMLLGNLRHRQVRMDEAAALFRRLIALTPNDAKANNFLAYALLHLGRSDEAERYVRDASRLAPDDPEVLTNMGLILQANLKLDEAAAAQRRAVALRPDMAEAWNNLGLSLQYSDQWDKAVQSFDRAIALKPDFAAAKTNKAHAVLAMGRLREGWDLYRHRFTQKLWAPTARSFPYPQWSGQTDRSLKLLVWTDQGLGDEVLYSSIIADAAGRVGQCMLECTDKMVPLFQRAFPNIDIVPLLPQPDARIADYKPDAQVSLIDLGALFRPEIASIPRHDGYLRPDPQARMNLRQKYEAIAQGRRIVGISWCSANPQAGAYKSTHLAQWRAILTVPDVLFVSLQYGNIHDQLDEARTLLGVEIVRDETVDAFKNPDLSAAQIAAMDLTITTSNTTAHFAGAMNIPVWTLVPTGPGALWYWFLRRSDSPWYPSMRLFRQPHAGAWAAVMEDVAKSLTGWAAH